MENDGVGSTAAAALAFSFSLAVALASFSFSLAVALASFSFSFEERRWRREDEPSCDGSWTYPDEDGDEETAVEDPGDKVVKEPGDETAGEELGDPDWIAG